MNHRPYFTKGFLLILVLLVTACAAPQATSTTTSEPPSIQSSEAQGCSTNVPQACPTAAAQAIPVISPFRFAVMATDNAFITFEAGDKCSMKVNKLLTDGEGLAIDVVVKDDTYQNYNVFIQYLDPGKSLDDLKKLTDPITAPPWVHIIGAVMATPMSRTFYADVEITPAAQGPIYFTCQADGPVPRKFIDHVGPLEFTGAP